MGRESWWRRHLTLVLVLWGIFFLAQAPIYLPEIFSGPATTRPFAINSVVKDVLMAAVLFAAAAEPLKRARLVMIAALGMTILTALLAATIVTGDTAYSFPPPRWWEPAITIAPDARADVWCVLAAAASVLLWLTARAAVGARSRQALRALRREELPPLAGAGGPLLAALGQAPELPPRPKLALPPQEPLPPVARDPSIPGEPLTLPEIRLRASVRILAALFALMALAMLGGVLALPGGVDWLQATVTALGVVLFALFAGQCLRAASQPRRHGLALMPVLALAVPYVVLLVVAAATAGASDTYRVAGGHLSFRDVAIVGAALLAAIALLLALLYLAARRARFNLAYLTGSSFEALAALADGALEPEAHEVLPMEQVARNVDRYISSLDAPQRIFVPVALTLMWVAPLLLRGKPLPLLSHNQRRWFVELCTGRELGNLRSRLRYPLEGVVRLAQQMVYLGYYNDPRTFASVDFKPFSQRPRAAVDVAKARGNPRLRTLAPTSVPRERLTADLVIVGSGAAGSMIAYRLAEQGRNVLILEGGKHVDPDAFTEDEAHQLTQLYADGALQQTAEFSFTMLQGKCVGGSTTVNNAVCFNLPPQVRSRWLGELCSGLDGGDLDSSYAEMRAFLQVSPLDEQRAMRGWRKFRDGVSELELQRRGYTFKPVDTNILDCPACGNCNIGCRYGNKLSALQWTLPAAQGLPGEVEILPECHVRGIEVEGGRARELVADLAGRRLRVRANTIVVSAGAIASPYLLLRSGIATGLAGRRLGFNLASPVTARFDDEIEAFDGVQISHYVEAPELRFAIETWFNPVVSQALNMPGWRRDHWNNMHKLRKLTAAGVVVGTRTEDARLRRGVFPWPTIEYTPGVGDDANADDFRRLKEGLALTAEIFLRAGAEAVMFNTFHYREFKEIAEVRRGLDELAHDAGDLSCGTGHPQCGNAMHVDPARGVVRPDFRVHGFENLFVCDASVFPCAITVNPQLTVMALANLAARSVLERTSAPPPA